MASNSFSLKTVSVTLSAAVVAYYGAVPGASWLIALGAWASIVAFWILDAKYLQLERLFRALYDGVRTGTISEPYSMSIASFQADAQSVWRIAISWSVVWIYALLVVLLALVLASRSSPPAAHPVAPPPGASSSPSTTPAPSQK